MALDAPYFEVVTPAADAAARRLVTVAYVAARMEGEPADAVVDSHIDEVSASFAAFARLATDAAMTPPTFASETLRATWSDVGLTRGTELHLPWRVPVTSITSIVEDGETLVSGTDYRLLPGARIERLSEGDPYPWSSDDIVVTYVAGWTSLSSNAPPDLQAAAAAQIKYRLKQIPRDAGLRSVSVDELRSETYNVPGGDSIGASGLLIQVEHALAPYRNFFV